MTQNKSRPRILKRALLALVLFIVAIQIIPLWRLPDPVRPATEPRWDSPATRATFMRACGDCHSDNSRLPWYSHLAPVSWLVRHDIVEGREKLNVSHWAPGRYKDEHESAEQLTKGEMPPEIYLLMHADARISEDEKTIFAEGLRKTFGNTRDKENGSGEESEDDDEEDGH